MTANLRIIPRNFHADATVATQYAPVDGFTIARTQNTIREDVWRAADGSDQFVSGYYSDGISRTSSFWSFWRHRCHGGNVRLQLYSDTGFSTQVLDTGTNPIINVTPSDGFNWGISPYGINSIDPFLLKAPYWIWVAPTAHKSYKWTFSGNVSTFGYAYWQVSSFFHGLHVEFVVNPDYGASLGFVPQVDRARTRGGSLRTNQGEDYKIMEMDLNAIAESERAGMLDIMHYNGLGREFVISMFPTLDTRLERDNMAIMQFASLEPLTRQVSYLTKRLSMEEV